MKTAMLASVSLGTSAARSRLDGSSSSFSRLIFIIEWRKFPIPKECAAAHGKEG
jgi:hypothetical protein